MSNKLKNKKNMRKKNRIILSENFIQALIDNSEIECESDPDYVVASSYLGFMKVSDYLFLTTLGNWEADEIIKSTVNNSAFRKSKGMSSPEWDNEGIDNLDVGSISAIWVRECGQIEMHDGRHRASIAAHSKIGRIPVVIHCVDRDMNKVQAFKLDKIKDQYHKGERMTLDAKLVYPIPLVKSAAALSAIKQLHGFDKGLLSDNGLDKNTPII